MTSNFRLCFRVKKVFLLLSIIWLRGRKLYEVVFRRSYSPLGFILANIKINLPIVLPWLALSLVFDLLALLPWPGLQEVLASSWGDLILFGFFVCFLALFFPPLVRWLWGCKPMPPGPLRDHIESFCRAQGFHSEILYWPLFEGQVLTAAVLGIVPRFRYLMITPGLAAALDEEELDAVLAHEIGHVKRYHLVQYVLLFLGFSVLAGKLVEPLPYLLLGSDFFYNILQVFPVDPDTMLAAVSLVVLLGFMLLYFRFIFGYFIRNFERQADLYVFQVQGTAWPLIRAFEKIILLEPGKRVGIENIEIVGLPTQHLDPDAIGFKFYTPYFVLSYSSDTKYYKDLVQAYEGSDILILNVTMPGEEKSDKLNVEGAIKLISQVKPRLVIITHFGLKMIKQDPIIQAREIQRRTGIQTIAAKDGMAITPGTYSAKSRQKTLLDMQKYKQIARIILHLQGDLPAPRE